MKIGNWLVNRNKGTQNGLFKVKGNNCPFLILYIKEMTFKKIPQNKSGKRTFKNKTLRRLVKRKHLISSSGR